LVEVDENAANILYWFHESCAGFNVTEMKYCSTRAALASDLERQYYIDYGSFKSMMDNHWRLLTGQPKRDK
jgi:hypothetical protein